MHPSAHIFGWGRTLKAWLRFRKNICKSFKMHSKKNYIYPCFFLCFTQTAMTRALHLSCWPLEGSEGIQVWRMEGEPSPCPSQTSPGQWSEMDQRWLPFQPFPLLLCTQRWASQRFNSVDHWGFRSDRCLCLCKEVMSTVQNRPYVFTWYITCTCPFHILLVLSETLQALIYLYLYTSLTDCTIYCFLF